MTAGLAVRDPEDRRREMDREARALSVTVSDWALDQQRRAGIDQTVMAWALMYAAVRCTWMTTPLGSEVEILKLQRTMFDKMITGVIEHFEAQTDG